MWHPSVKFNFNVSELLKSHVVRARKHPTDDSLSLKYDKRTLVNTYLKHPPVSLTPSDATLPKPDDIIRKSFKGDCHLLMRAVTSNSIMSATDYISVRFEKGESPKSKNQST